jgi:hypothetical protein
MKAHRGIYLLAFLAFGAAILPVEEATAARICPASGPDDTFIATLNSPGDCVTNEVPGGITRGRGRLFVKNPPGGAQGRRVEAYLFSSAANNKCTKARGRKIVGGVAQNSCTVLDTKADGVYEPVSTAYNAACDYTSEVWVTVYDSTSCT